MRYSDDPEVRAAEEILDKEIGGTAEAGSFLKAFTALSKDQQTQMYADTAEWMAEIGTADLFAKFVTEVVRGQRKMPSSVSEAKKMAEDDLKERK